MGYQPPCGAPAVADGARCAARRGAGSVDFRFQDGRVPTLRSHPGFVLGSDKPAAQAADEFGATLIATDEDWQDASPARRLSDLQKAANEPGVGARDAAATAVGGHAWAMRHDNADSLIDALQLERQRWRHQHKAHSSTPDYHLP